jgi:hypothetical protein
MQLTLIALPEDFGQTEGMRYTSSPQFRFKRKSRIAIRGDWWQLEEVTRHDELFIVEYKAVYAGDILT